MWPIIISLLAVGTLLLVVEVFVPGMIVGTAGVLALIAATFLAYTHYGMTAGNTLLFFELLGGTVFVVWWFRYIPHSSFAQRWTLHTAVPPAVEESEPVSVGQTGTAGSTLRPAGIAIIGDKRVDVVSEGDLIKTGETVRVIKVEGNRVVVRSTR